MLLYPQAPRKWEFEPFLRTAIALRIAITVTVALHHAEIGPATCVSCQNELHVRPRVIAVFARPALGILSECRGRANRSLQLRGGGR
jgi:hypothetical protein